MVLYITVHGFLAVSYTHLDVYKRQPVEKQIQMLFAAFDIANPGVATFQEFLDYCLDTYGLDEFMNSLEELMDDLMSVSYTHLSEC